MQVNVEQKEGGQVSLRITVEPERLQQETERVFRQTAREVSVPGFRPGRAPRAMIEARLNMEAVKQEALERLTNICYLQALQETGLEPIDRAQVDEQELAEDGGFSFLAKVAVMPEVQLGEYRGLQVTRPTSQVTDEAVTQEIERLRTRFTQYESQAARAVESGDIAIIDYELEVEGEKVDEAGVSGYPLEVGADTLLDELNEGLLGAKVGETRSITGVLPKSFPKAEAAGKEAVFVVTVQDIKTRLLPELDDEFARKVAAVKDLEELRQKVRESLEGLSRHMAEQAVRDRLIGQIAQASQMEIPAVLVERFKQSREDEMASELGKQGYTIENYLQAQQKSYADWQKEIEAEATESLRRFLILREIEKKEQIEATQEEISAEIARLAQLEQTSPAAKRRELEKEGGIEDIASRLRRDKAVRLIEENAEITEEEAAPEPPGQIEGPEHGKDIDAQAQ